MFKFSNNFKDTEKATAEKVRLFEFNCKRLQNDELVTWYWIHGYKTSNEDILFIKMF